MGQATARVLNKSPWRVVLMASSSWSHSFLTEKNYQLWPDVAACLRAWAAAGVVLAVYSSGSVENISG